VSFSSAVVAALAGRQVSVMESTESTNRDAFGLALGGAPSGTVVVSDAQTGGRGRLGRSWYSPPNANLYFSMVFRPRLSPGDAPLLCLAAAVSIVRVLRGPPWRTGLKPDLFIKWPNDVVTSHGYKVAGLLAEMESSPSGLDFVVVGVGLNVNQDAFPLELPVATSLSLLRGTCFDRALLLGELVTAIEAGVVQVETDREAMLESWRSFSHTLGRRIQVAGHEGLAFDLRPDGALLLRKDDGTVQPVLAGDVELVAEMSSEGAGPALEPSPRSSE
jgi:BirA family transcriptional regulator, biotin operon repressor / biotin---[acetyl-CoA-carboxylase] ligase